MSEGDKRVDKQIWFCSDTHFSHTNILKYCNRPFGSIEEHDQILVENWNSVVNPGDDVYHLGDFGFAPVEKLVQILHQLNGNIYHIQGNHDRNMTGKVHAEIAWQKFYHELKIPDDEMETTQGIVLCHYPFERWNKQFHGFWHLHGHVHSTLPSNGLARLDVGVDNVAKFLPESELQQRYRPISYQEVKTYFTQQIMKQKTG